MYYPNFSNGSHPPTRPTCPAYHHWPVSINCKQTSRRPQFLQASSGTHSSFRMLCEFILPVSPSLSARYCLAFLVSTILVGCVLGGDHHEDNHCEDLEDYGPLVWRPERGGCCTDRLRQVLKYRMKSEGNPPQGQLPVEGGDSVYGRHRPQVRGQKCSE